MEEKVKTIMEYKVDDILEVVKNYGYALKYVEHQTPEMCLAAVRGHGWALEFVETQTPEICLEAVKQDVLAMQYVDDAHKEQVEQLLATEGLSDKPVYANHISNAVIHNVKNNPDKLTVSLFHKDYSQGVNVLVDKSHVYMSKNAKTGVTTPGFSDVKFGNASEDIAVRVKENNKYVTKQMTAQDLVDGHKEAVSMYNAKKREIVKSVDVESGTSVEDDKNFGE